jgi:DNA polymerase III epsilon subunit-like protein
MNLVFDTETTGLTRHPNAKDAVQPRIIEFAAVRCDAEGIVKDSLTLLVNPGMMVTEEITKITGITNEMLEGKPSFEEVWPQIEAYMTGCRQAIAHNLPFDTMMVELEAARIDVQVPWPERRLCTVQEHLPLWGFRPKLTTLYEHYTGTPLNQTHRALDDVEALVVVCKMAGVLI